MPTHKAILGVGILSLTVLLWLRSRKRGSKQRLSDEPISTTQAADQSSTVADAPTTDGLEAPHETPLTTKTSQEQDKQTLDEDVFVVVWKDEINNNNLQEGTGYPYAYTHLDSGQPFQRPTQVAKGEKMCHLCFRKFETWTKVEIHKAKPCYLDPGSSPEDSLLIKVEFEAEQLIYTQDCISSLDLELHVDGNQRWFSVPRSMLEITLRRLYFAQITKYNLEQWYPSLVDHTGETSLTTKTLFLPLSDDELHLISKLASVTLARNLGMNSRETNAELAARDKLQDKIDVLIGSQGKDWFCRLSTRSPKDAVATRLGETDLVERMTEKVNSLKVTNGMQVLDLITRSQRIFSDISMFFQYRVKNCTSDSLCLILREWLEMPQDHEFRCFVHNRKLTAISQYHCYYPFPRLQDPAHIERIKGAISAYHSKITGLIALPSYVIDIAVFPDLEYQCHTIELNPFGSSMSSGAALFNWKQHGDLLYGREHRTYPAMRVLRQLADAPEQS